MVDKETKIIDEFTVQQGGRSAHATMPVDPNESLTIYLGSNVKGTNRSFDPEDRKRLSSRAVPSEEAQGSLEKEKLDGKRTDGLSHAPPPRESRKRLVSRFKCPGIYWVGQIQRSWPLPRPSASPCTYYAHRHIDAEYDGSPRSRLSPSLISRYVQPTGQFSSAGKPLGPRECSA